VPKLNTIFCVSMVVFIAGCASSPNQKMRNNAVKSSASYIQALSACNIKNNELQSNQFVMNNIVSNDKNRYILNSSNQKLDDEMKVKFISYLDGITNCRKEVREKFLNMPYQFREIVINHEDAIDAQYINLLTNKTTIGEFNISRERIRIKSNSELQKVREKFDDMAQPDRQATTKPASTYSASNAIAVGAVCALTSNPALCASTAINSSVDSKSNSDRRLDELESKAQRQKFNRIIEDGRLRDVESKIIDQENKKRTNEIIDFKTKKLN